ncbi:hypothetical protein GY24_09645 [Microterricola pindariensis]|uniref:peptide chain release factor N(5)-glutamine methyltransferase n=1 Tax=Microterricola pindariensis TaxID=478010 RepID=A0ABX5AW65_9MICO|nr:hypothetical protein GY24_09645 [Microterricola pindariensis]
MPPPEAQSLLPELVRALRAGGSVFAEDEAALLAQAAGGDPARLAGLLAERLDGRPLEQVLGWAEFAGIRIGVAPGVFVPRRRTELLAREAIAACAPGAIAVDLCCGSGAIGAAILAARPGVRLYASDVSAASVACAAGNLAGRATVLRGDLFAALPGGLRGRIDVLAVNAPYVPSEAIAFMPPEAREHEPLASLDGGSDGLDVHRRIAAEAAEWLHPSSTLLIETSSAQAGASAALFSAAGFTTRIARDETRDATVIVATA